MTQDTGRDAWLFPGPGHGVVPDPEQATGLATAAARCFAGVDGQCVLEALVGMTLHRTAGPALPDAALRHLEGQRALVAWLLALIDRGGGVVPLYRKTCSNERTE
ncbi:hypothetical protein [Haematospirillum sp. H1815]|uniref:Bbp19 family protein n=1 Tax=Haematospirillum sp. H1815 TaxID=2723108 RepID=UPI001ADE6365|nr:hypothetical protein [Haematospirillum sp. H1815]